MIALAKNGSGTVCIIELQEVPLSLRRWELQLLSGSSRIRQFQSLELTKLRGGAILCDGASASAARTGLRLIAINKVQKYMGSHTLTASERVFCRATRGCIPVAAGSGRAGIEVIQ